MAKVTTSMILVNSLGVVKEKFGKTISASGLRIVEQNLKGV